VDKEITMKRVLFSLRNLTLFLFVSAFVLGAEAQVARADHDAVRVVDLVQTPGAAFPHRLHLPAGHYIFRVRNHGVDHAVSLRLSRIEADGSVGPLVASLLQPVLSGQVGETYVVALSTGRYTYRSAENPTPHYFIDVE
jgi:hypothetical protein